MINTVIKLSRAAATASRVARVGFTSRGPSLHSPSPPFRSLHDGINGSIANKVVLQMINYALSLSRSQKSDESYAQGMLVLEHCLSTQSNEGECSENSRGMVFLAMSTLLSERGNFDEAMEKLQTVQDLTHSSLAVRVAAVEALVGLHLELGHDDTSSVLADNCLELLEKYELNTSSRGSEIVSAHAQAVKGLVELVHGNLESANSFFQEFFDKEGCTSGAALSYGEFLHATQNFSLAKELYEKAIQGVVEYKKSPEIHTFGACNLAPEEVTLAATCALGQLEARMGNFDDAEETLTSALTKMEEHFGCHHPKVGVVLTCIALMFQHKAMQERSSSLLIQEGLYRRALECLKAPPLEYEDAKIKVDRRDIVALARGGYAEVLCVQPNRKGEGEKMRSWAEAAWRNRRISLAEALDFSKPSNNVPVIDTRISRVL